jgi:hypothetical protein
MKNETEVFVGIDVSKDWLDINSGTVWRIAMRTEEKNRAKNQITCTTMKRHILKMIKFISYELSQIEKQINSVIENSEALSEKATVLQRETSVGPVLTMTLLADLPELGTISRQQVAALVGVAPYTNQSGATWLLSVQLDAIKKLNNTSLPWFEGENPKWSL